MPDRLTDTDVIERLVQLHVARVGRKVTDLMPQVGGTPHEDRVCCKNQGIKGCTQKCIDCKGDTCTSQIWYRNL
jgi:hypothetical protein